MGLDKTEVLGAVFNCVAEEGARKMEHEHTLKVQTGNGTGVRTWRGLSGRWWPG